MRKSTKSTEIKTAGRKTNIYMEMIFADWRNSIPLSNIIRQSICIITTDELQDG